MTQESKRNSLLGRAASRLRYEMSRARIRRSFRHLHGPKAPGRDNDGVVVVALVRNGSYYLDAFLAHYRQLGASRFVFCDNGSTDDTVDRIARESDTVILQSDLPWGVVESEFRRYAAERYAAGQWCLFADMDEMFDFEGSERIGLTGLTRYLSQNGYTALVAQMLDLFPKEPLKQVACMPYAEVLERFSYYEPNCLTRQDYHDPDIDFSYFLALNEVSQEKIKVFSGGVRGRVFDEQCCLTKHPLVHVTGGVIPGVHPHCAAHVRCADFTGLIRHYKFANDPAQRDADVARRKVIMHGDDQKRLRVFAGDEGLTLFDGRSRELEGLEQLVEEGFLVRSAEFAAYLEECGWEKSCPV